MPNHKRSWTACITVAVLTTTLPIWAQPGINTLAVAGGDVPSLLIGMFLPAVQRVREAAARQQATQNLRQVSIATPRPPFIGNCIGTGLLITASGDQPAAGTGQPPGAFPLFLGGSVTTGGPFFSTVLGNGSFTVDATGKLNLTGTGGVFEGFPESSATATIDLTGKIIIYGLAFPNGGTESLRNSVSLIGLPQAACTDQANAGDPVSTATGELHSEFAPDLDLGGGPLRLYFQRYYSSLLKFNGISSPMAANWMNNFDMRLYLYGSNKANATIARFGGALRRRAALGNWSPRSATWIS